MRKLALLILLCPSFVFSQGLSADEKDFIFPNFGECGLITRWASNSISPSCLQEAKNVLLDEDLSLYRRRGSAKYNATPCEDAKAIKGMWRFDATDGQRYIIIHSSQSLFYTKNQGDCTHLTGASNLNATAELDCVQALGKLWCVNGIDNGFSIDSALAYTTYPPSEAVTTTTVSMPLGTRIGTFRNRLIMAGVAGKMSRILLSGEGNGTDWVLKIPGQSTSPSSIDISGMDDGKEVKALMGQYQNAYQIGREDDIYTLSGNDRRDFTLRQLSSQIGVLDNRTVREKDNSLIWLSRRGVEKQSGTTIQRISDGIRPTVDVIIGATGNTRTKTYNTQSEWEAGLYSTTVGGNGPTSTSIFPGSIVPSTWTKITSEPADWVAGTLVNIDTYTNSGYIQLSESSTITRSYYPNTWAGATYDASGCATSEYEAGTGWVKFSATDWTCNDIARFKADRTMGFTDFGISSNSAWSTSVSWSFGDTYTGASGPANRFLRYYFISTTDSEATTSGYMFEISHGLYSSLYVPHYRLYSVASGVITLLGDYTSGAIGYGGLSATSYILKTYDNHLKVCSDSTGSSCSIDVAISNLPYSNYTLVTSSFPYPTSSFPTPSLRWNYFKTVTNVLSGRVSTGTFTSPVYDTTLSTPVGGPFYFDDYAPVGSTIAYSVRESSKNVAYSVEPGVWSSWTTVSTTTSGEFRVPFTKRYWQEQIELSTQYSTQTPYVAMTQLEATTTGYYIADCINTTGVTSWGNFRPSSILDGNASISFAVSTGSSCNEVTRSTANWVSQLSNAPLTVSTSPFLGVRVFESPTSSSETLRLDALTQEWNEGSERPPSASAVHKDRYYLFYTTDTASGAKNDHALVLDINDKWTLLDNINAYSAVVYENKLFTGDSNDSGYIYQQDIGSDDDGEDYEFKVKTIDYDFGNPVELKKLKRIYLTLKSEERTGQNIDLTVKYYIDGSTTSYSMGDADLNEAVEKGYFVAKFPASNEMPTTFHWLSIEISYTGAQGPLNVYQIRTVYSPIRWE